MRAHLDALTHAVPDMPVEDRTADTWEPLVAIADLAGGHWPTQAREALLTLTADRDAASEVSLRVRLLMDVRDAFGPAKALPSRVLLDRLRWDEEAPWSDLGVGGLTIRKLAHMLREYDITPTNHRWEDGTQSKGYLRLDFTDAWSRYCPDPQGEPSQPSQPSQPRSERDGSPPWDGSSVPAPLSVPGLTCDATLGTDRDGSPPTPDARLCEGCGHRLAYDDGTHTHPGCGRPAAAATSARR